jgi:hypothetical protein
MTDCWNWTIVRNSIEMMRMNSTRMAILRMKMTMS